MNWPASLEEIYVTGSFAESTLSTISWPPNLTTLDLDECNDLSADTFELFLSAPHLSTTLRRLSISEFNRYLDADSINIIPTMLPELEFLRVPYGLVEDSFFSRIAGMPTPWPLRTLELDYFTEPGRIFSLHSLRQALSKGLPMLRSLGFASPELSLRDKEVDDILRKRAEMQNISSDPGVGVGIYSYCSPY